MNEPLLYSAAIMMGLFSTPHCVGMCGGLISAMGLGIDESGFLAKLSCVVKYNLGRLLSYSLLGVLFGLVGSAFQELLPSASSILRIAAASLMILSGLYISGWWAGLRHLETALYALWSKLQNRRPYSTNTGMLLAGVTWGCLPCGLVYTALTMAMMQSSAWQGGLFMFSFGLGTLPVLIGIGLISASFGAWLKQKWIKAGAGLALISYGLWTLFGLQQVLSMA